jgi:hypothetical protein
MRKLVLAALAMTMMAVVAAQPAVAQEMKKMEKTDKMEKMEKMKQKSAMMKGTMTAPGEEAVEIAYEMAMGDGGAKGWIVADGDDGEKVKMEMKDLSMDGDHVSYNWSPPDEASLVISCSLEKQADGGFAGDCKDNQDESRTGQMTIAPMEGMNPCAAGMNPCSG